MRRSNAVWSTTNVLDGTAHGELKAGKTMSFEIAPGDAACLRLTSRK
jgi:hypothetical protein